MIFPCSTAPYFDAYKSYLKLANLNLHFLHSKHYCKYDAALIKSH